MSVLLTRSVVWPFAGPYALGKVDIDDLDHECVVVDVDLEHVLTLA